MYLLSRMEVNKTAGGDNKLILNYYTVFDTWQRRPGEGVLDDGMTEWGRGLPPNYQEKEIFRD